MDSPSLFIRKVNIVFEKDMLQMIQDLIKKFEDKIKVNLENHLIKECLIKELNRLKIEEEITKKWIDNLNHPYL
jgi:hypothetical protein